MKRSLRNIYSLLLIVVLIINCNLANDKNDETIPGKNETSKSNFSDLQAEWIFAEGKSFSGGKNSYGNGSGDNRGNYEIRQGVACFTSSPADYPGIDGKPLHLENMEISVIFGTLSGNTIPLTIRQISLQTENIYNYETAVSRNVYSRSPEPDLVWSGNGTISQNRIDLKIKDRNFSVIACFRIFKLSESALAIRYDFNTENPMAGYGIAFINDETYHTEIHEAFSAQSIADKFDIEAIKPKNIPVSRIPDLDWMEFYGTIKAGGSAFSFKSGKWNGVIQIDFIKPYSYAEHPVSMIIIDESGISAEKQICNFNDPDGTNKYYYSWGANIRLPEPDRRYTAVFRNYTGTDIQFRAKSW